jgi:hypothetical protein
MTPQGKSCAVAIPTQRNSATHGNSATPRATSAIENSRKPASIQELRAQLRAQQCRNDDVASSASADKKVAHQLGAFESCGVAVSRNRNRATAQLDRFLLDECSADPEASVLARLNNMAFEFMTVDGMEFDEAIRVAAEIVAYCAVAACEASYEDVQALWKRIAASGTAQAP